jgi:putative flippase GtrA
VVDVVIPVYNEQATLVRSVDEVARYLRGRLPYSARITVADNASTDGTWDLAASLAQVNAVARRADPTIPEVRAVRLEQKGRGRALRQVWLESDADVLAYMDVDLSTHLDALPALIAPLVSGHSQLAIGTRLARTSHVQRGLKREVISRCYNQLLRRTMSARFSDAQCGFKAITATAARELLPLVEDTGWFFDTELLVLAEHAGLRIYEVPVDWDDDPDSRVDIVSTAVADLRGMARVRRSLASGRLPLPDVAARLGLPWPATRGLGSQIWRFAVVGVACTVFYSAAYMLLRSVIHPQAANFIAYAASAVLGTAGHRRITFGVRDRATLWRHHGQGLVVFAASWGLSALALAALHGVIPDPSSFVEVALLTCTNLVATAARFVLFRSWVFRAWATRKAS